MHEMHTHTCTRTRDWREWHERERRSRIKWGTKVWIFKAPEATFQIFLTKRCSVKDGGRTRREKGSKTCFRTATKSFMRRNKAADRWLERKIWPLYLAVRKKLTAERESETKGGKQARCPKQQLLWNKRHIRAKYPRTQKPELVTSRFTSTTSPVTCKGIQLQFERGGGFYT